MQSPVQLCANSSRWQEHRPFPHPSQEQLARPVAAVQLAAVGCRQAVQLLHDLVQVQCHTGQHQPCFLHAHRLQRRGQLKHKRGREAGYLGRGFNQYARGKQTQLHAIPTTSVNESCFGSSSSCLEKLILNNRSYHLLSQRKDQFVSLTSCFEPLVCISFSYESRHV